MEDKYEEWIKNNIPEDCYGQCAERTLEMQTVFPELKRVRGHYYGIFHGVRPHWWLKDEKGNIIDPTKSQFPNNKLGFYDEWDESQLEPTGKCPNCGGFAYNEYCCSEKCTIEYTAYCNNPF